MAHTVGGCSLALIFIIVLLLVKANIGKISIIESVEGFVV